ncbi:MAG: ABC transporter permease [Solirubrobacteraceae bacterium]|nr:ABC transporter permease [Solirubrobacteraceae bacterium]
MSTFATGAVLAQGDFYTDRSASGGSCVSANGFCPGWIADNFDQYLVPLRQHALLTITAVAIGFAIAFSLALISERRRWLVGPITQLSGILYTVPTLAAFFLLLPVTGRGFVTAEVALVAYTLLILFRGVRTGLDGVPPETVDAARGVGLTERQLMWQVKLPLALPQIVAALRVASSTTVGLATLAFFAGGGGLGGKIYADLTFKSNVVLAGLLCVLLAAAIEIVLVLVQRRLTPWMRAVQG